MFGFNYYACYSTFILMVWFWWYFLMSAYLCVSVCVLVCAYTLAVRYMVGRSYCAVSSSIISHVFQLSWTFTSPRNSPLSIYHMNIYKKIWFALFMCVHVLIYMHVHICACVCTCWDLNFSPQDCSVSTLNHWAIPSVDL